MTEPATILGLYAETHIHPGVGQSIGAIDLPVSRERTTDHPVIPGSSTKGALRVWAKEKAGIDGAVIDELFGPKTTDGTGNDPGSDLKAGTLICTDARLLLLPVRCLSAAFKWATCPGILRRLKRDAELAGLPLGAADAADLQIPDETYRGSTGTADGHLALEERTFCRSGEIEKDTIALLSRFVGDERVLKERLVLLSDKDFAWFARYGLPVAAHNALEENTKVSTTLWYEETLAPDTVIYLLLLDRALPEKQYQPVQTIADKLGAAPYIQIGGNETTGQGWFKMSKVA